MCRFINNFLDIQNDTVTTDESIILKLAEDVYFMVAFVREHLFIEIELDCCTVGLTRYQPCSVSNCSCAGTASASTLGCTF